MSEFSIDTKYIRDHIKESDLLELEKEIFLHQERLRKKTGTGKDFLGWIDLPAKIAESDLKDINEAASRLAAQSDTVVVVGIGGSYLGARAVIEALQDPFQQKKKDSPEVIYAGHHISEDYLASLLKNLEERDPSVIVISKSGTTTEPAIAFRFLRNYLEKRFGKEGAQKRIIAITDRSKGALRKLSEQEGYQSFVIPNDVGGRYSVLTPVGLLPIAAAGWNIDKLVKGAENMASRLALATSLAEHPAGWYAAARNLLYRKGKPIEVMVNYEPHLGYISEWWKQLYGESEGKEHRGIFPAAVNFTTDLHSMGQYLQDGLRVMFETVIRVNESRQELQIPVDAENLDGLNYISGMRLQEVNHMAEEGTLLAHVDGGVPNIRINIPEVNEYHIGELLYFFEMACAISGYLLEVNPFDQPGVEAYKKNMFALLGKPGFEKETEALRKRL